MVLHTFFLKLFGALDRICNLPRSLYVGAAFNPAALVASVWNGIPLALGLLPRVHSDAFYSSLKTALFSRARVRALLSSNLEDAI